MPEHSDNPFKELGKRLFPCREAREKSPAAPTIGPLEQKRATRIPRETPAEDEILFLEAVGNIRRSRSVSAGAEYSPFAEALGHPGSGTPPEQSAGMKKPPAQKASPTLASDSYGAADVLPAASSKRAAPAPAASQDGDTSAPGGDADLFSKAMRGVNPLAARGRDVHGPRAPGKVPLAVDPHKLLRDILEGRVEFALHHTGDFMEGFVSGLDPLLIGRLRAGQFSPEAHVDLHGYNSLQAYDLLIGFIKSAWQRNLRTVIVVTGRGKNSPDGIGILRSQLGDWLTKDPLKRVILAFCTAQPHDGGLGAVYVLLRKYKKSRGKILWERRSPMETA